MKDKIIIFVVGLLLGAVIATGAIYVYTLANSSNNNNGGGQQGMQMPNSNMPGGQNSNMGQPPEMPSNNQASTN